MLEIFEILSQHTSFTNSRCEEWVLPNDCLAWAWETLSTKRCLKKPSLWGECVLEALP